MSDRVRSAAIILKDNQILLMERNNHGKHYWIFPGGKVEENETLEEAALREVAEETTIQTKLTKKLYSHYYEDSDAFLNNQHFFLGEYISGEPQLSADSEELQDNAKGQNLYYPQWVPTEKLPGLLLYPLEIRDWLIEDLKNNFSQTPREAKLKEKDLKSK